MTESSVQLTKLKTSPTKQVSNYNLLGLEIQSPLGEKKHFSLVSRHLLNVWF